jgi:hypothetical protein
MYDQLTPFPMPACGQEHGLSPLRAPKSVDTDIFMPLNMTSTEFIVVSGRDSDLEAFSLNPSDGSFAALAFRPAT